ncbi:MAG: PAS domain S-box protein, partial [Rhodocyclaceae bacterium]|nr:PAS domain S-box protein [Rhodocyclaceae bacterium]
MTVIARFLLRMVRGARSRWLFPVALLPGIAALLILSYATYTHEQADLELGTLQTARALAQAVDAELAGAQAILAGLRLSWTPGSEAGTLTPQARQAVAVFPGAAYIAVFDGQGRGHLHTLAPPDRPLPRLQADMDGGFPSPPAAGRVSDLVSDGVARRPLLTLDLPAAESGGPPYLFRMGLGSERLAGLLARQKLPPGWMSAVYDRRGITVARSRHHDEFLGRPAAAALRARMQEAAEGFGEVTTLEGIPVFAAHSRSADSGFTVTVGVPVAEFQGKLKQTLGMALLALIAVLLGTLWIVWRLTGQFLASIQEFATVSRAAAAGDRDARVGDDQPEEFRHLAEEFNGLLRGRQEAESRLSESETRFHGLFHNMVEGIAHCRLIYEGGLPEDFVYLDVNPAFEGLTGLRDVVGRRVSEVMPGLNRARHPEQFDLYGAVAAGGGPRKAEIFVEEAGLWFSMSLYGPRQGEFIAIFDNITARKEAEAALLESETKFRLLAENSSDCVFWIDPEGRFRYVSPACESLSGYRPEEFLADPGLMLRIVDPEDRPAYAAHLAAGYTDDAAELELRIVRKDGEARWISHHCRVLRDEAGVFLGRRGHNRDITERRTAEDQIRKLSLAVEQSSS